MKPDSSCSRGGPGRRRDGGSRRPGAEPGEIACQVPGSRLAFDHLAKLLARRAALAESPRPQEALRVLEVLFRCELPYCAPDGRPTLSEFSLRELERRFVGVKSTGF